MERDSRIAELVPEHIAVDEAWRARAAARAEERHSQTEIGQQLAEQAARDRSAAALVYADLCRKLARGRQLGEADLRSLRARMSELGYGADRLEKDKLAVMRFDQLQAVVGDYGRREADQMRVIAEQKEHVERAQAQLDGAKGKLKAATENRRALGENFIELQRLKNQNRDLLG